MAAVYSELVIDGVIGDIYDKAAIHTNQLQDAMITQLLDPNVKSVILNLFFPVGSIKIGGSDPGAYLGGTWTLRPDLMIVGAGNLYPEGSQGGSPDAVVVEHNHVGSGTTGTAGAHTHTISGTAASAGWHGHPGNGWTFSVYIGTRESEDVGEISGKGWHMTQVKKGGSWGGYSSIPGAGTHTHSVSGSTTSNGDHTHTVVVDVANSGVSGTGKNMPPYRAYNIWERTA